MYENPQRLCTCLTTAQQCISSNIALHAHADAQFEQTYLPIIGDRDPYDLRQNSSALFPPEFYLNYLANPAVKAKIGATSVYSECPDPPFELFINTGDVSDEKNFLCPYPPFFF